MAIREIRLSNDEILRKTSREVETVDDRTTALTGAVGDNYAVRVTSVVREEQ